MRGPWGQVVIYYSYYHFLDAEMFHMCVTEMLCSQGDSGPKGLKGLKGASGFKVNSSAE